MDILEFFCSNKWIGFDEVRLSQGKRQAAAPHYIDLGCFSADFNDAIVWQLQCKSDYLHHVIAEVGSWKHRGLPVALAAGRTRFHYFFFCISKNLNFGKKKKRTWRFLTVSLALMLRKLGWSKNFRSGRPDAGLNFSAIKTYNFLMADHLAASELNKIFHRFDFV